MEKFGFYGEAISQLEKRYNKTIDELVIILGRVALDKQLGIDIQEEDPGLISDLELYLKVLRAHMFVESRMKKKMIAIKFTGSKKSILAIQSLFQMNNYKVNEGVRPYIDGSTGSELDAIEIDIPTITGWTKVPIGWYVYLDSLKSPQMMSEKEYNTKVGGTN